MQKTKKDTSIHTKRNTAHKVVDQYMSRNSTLYRSKYQGGFSMSANFQCIIQFNGSGGIRTHVPRRTTAFRVRLVMTTSIRFHIQFCRHIKTALL